MSSEDLDLLKVEIGLIVEDVKKAYRASGKRVTGNFEDGVEVVYSSNDSGVKGTIKGFTYLAGRGKTKNSSAGTPTLKEQILDWLKDRGIRPIEPKMSLKALAFVISRKIHREGTDSKRHLQVYEDVITQERIFDIIDKFAKINVNRIVNEITAELKILAQNV